MKINLNDFDDFVENNDSIFIERCTKSDSNNIKEEVKDFLKHRAIEHLKFCKKNLSEGIWIGVEKRKINSYFIWEENKVKNERDSRIIGVICFVVKYYNLTEEDLK